MPLPSAEGGNCSLRPSSYTASLFNSRHFIFEAPRIEARGRTKPSILLPRVRVRVHLNPRRRYSMRLSRDLTGLPSKAKAQIASGNHRKCIAYFIYIFMHFSFVRIVISVSKKLARKRTFIYLLIDCVSYCPNTT